MMQLNNKENINIFVDEENLGFCKKPTDKSPFISDSEDDDDDYERELFNNEKLLSPVFSIRSNDCTANNNLNNVVQKSSIKILNDKRAHISRIKSEYKTNTLNSSSKISLNSLSDITNTSRDSTFKRQSKTSISSLRNKRLYSLENNSIFSIEQKKSQIIQKLNKRSSKNLSNPYFYQYTQNKQPTQLPPLVPINPESSFVFSEFSSSSKDSSEDTLNFVGNKYISNGVFGNHIDEEPIDENGNKITENDDQDDGNFGNDNIHNNNNNNNDNNDNNNNNRNTNNLRRRDSGFASGSGSDESYNNSKNLSSDPNITTSSSSTGQSGETSTQSHKDSKRIKKIQRRSSGLFSETSMILQNPINSSYRNFSNKSSNVNNELISSKIHDTRSSRYSDTTIETQNLQFEKIDQNSSYYKRDILKTNLSALSIPENSIIEPNTVLTIKNLNTNDSNETTETRLKFFNMNLNNTSSLSMLPLHNNEDKSRINKLTLPDILSDSNTSATNSHSEPVNASNTRSNSDRFNSSNDSSYYTTNAASNFGYNGNIYQSSKDSQNSENSHAQLIFNNTAKKLMNGKDLEKNDEKNNKLDEGYDGYDGYHESRFTDKCGSFTAWILIICSLIAPPFWLIIASGYLDKTFGVFDKKFKIISVVLFGIFLLGSVIGICVGLGYGLRHV